MKKFKKFHIWAILLEKVSLLRLITVGGQCWTALAATILIMVVEVWSLG